MSPETFKALTEPTRFWSLSQVMSRPCPLPKEPGLYAWYFRQIPPRVPKTGCVMRQGLTLLYVGTAPKAPPTGGGVPSGNTLRGRIRDHVAGNTSGSTLRLTLGCLLSEDLRLRLRPVGSGRRLTFGEGEETLSAWMAENAFVAWQTHPEPWLAEADLIGSLSLPLNLAGNERHPFYRPLSAIRRQTRVTARIAST